MENNTSQSLPAVNTHAASQEFSKLNQGTSETLKGHQILDVIKRTTQDLRLRKSKPISFSTPLISLNDTGIIFPRTITVIQGQSGTHKSRFAGLYASIFLGASENSFLGFSLVGKQPTKICYIDTERNLVDQLPSALQSIQTLAGYKIEDNPPNFGFASLLEFDRGKRFDVLDVYLREQREQTEDHIFIILDVLTDCISDFNKTDDSMMLIDMLNMMMNSYNVTFLCLIHENPNQNKARGHLGTELINKATTVIQLQLESESNGVQGDLLRIRFLKCRNSKLPSPIYAKYDPVKNQLVEAEADSIKRMLEKRIKKAPEVEVLKYLGMLKIGHSYPKQEIVQQIIDQFEVSGKIATERLDSIVKSGQLFNNNGSRCFLQRKRGQQVVYFIETTADRE